MFHSVKIKNWKLTLFSAVCFLVFLAGCLLMLRASPPDHVKVREEQVGLKIDSDEEIEAFIARCGYAAEGVVSDEEIMIPKTWNDTYSAYNELQKQQGFDLRQYKGKPARKLIYAMSGSDSYITILTSGDRIIAAEICDMTANSAPQPLIPKE